MCLSLRARLIYATCMCLHPPTLNGLHVYKYWHKKIWHSGNKRHHLYTAMCPDDKLLKLLPVRTINYLGFIPTNNTQHISWLSWTNKTKSFVRSLSVPPLNNGHAPTWNYILLFPPLSGMSMPTDMLCHLGYMSNVHVDKQLSLLVYIDHQPITMHNWHEGDLSL